MHSPDEGPEVKKPTREFKSLRTEKGSLQDPQWKFETRKNAMNAIGRKREAERDYPEATRELEAWRQSLHSPEVLQGLADIRAHAFPDLQKQGVNVAALEETLKKFIVYPLPASSVDQKIRRLIDLLDRALLAIDTGAREGLLPGELTKAVIVTGGNLIHEVGLRPRRLKQRSGAPRQDFIADRLEEILVHLTPIRRGRYKWAANLVTPLGFPMTARAVSALVRSRRLADTA